MVSPSVWPQLAMRTPYSQRKLGASKVRYFYVTQNIKINFFRSRNFNIFYIFGFNFFSKRPIRSPTEPRKIPLSERKNFFSEVKFSISDVEKPDF